MTDFDVSAFSHVAQDCLCRKARMANRIITRSYDEALRPVGLKITQFTLLVAIGYGKPNSITQLADWLAMERTTLTRNLKLLEKEQIVVARLGDHHKSRAFELTDLGREKVKQAYPLWLEVQQQFRQKLEGAHWDEAHQSLSLLSHCQHDGGVP